MKISQTVYRLDIHSTLVYTNPVCKNMASPHIILNGKEHVIDGIHTLAALLDSLGMTNKPVIIELDGEAILPREFGQTPLNPGSRVEIISIVAGG